MLGPLGDGLGFWVVRHTPKLETEGFGFKLRGLGFDGAGVPGHLAPCSQDGPKLYTKAVSNRI